ncbi:hypothetical protein AD945_01720 [Gluconobacter albidus]|uniref:Uncharacterized protein n=1 Tax=Gluconobacter albidus TaxID=318683 RepID=A0A149TMT3_9PROT|nr:hypothetical protein [Gluconobacter albidus]KXV50580.1 hypothetical protein AD945_01720 [Gluconobacter albidus]
MTSWEIAFYAACLVIVLLCLVLVWVSILARQAQKAKDAEQAAQAAQAEAATQRAMSQAQTDAAPTDEALGTALTNGTFVLLLVLLPFGLSACSVRPITPCPVLVTYSKADDLALKAELDASKTPVTHRYIRDYGGLRAQVRVCAKGQ